MGTEKAITNESFDFLKGSSDFLNIILNNISSSVLVLDKDIRLRAFNDVLKTLFSNKKDENLLYMRCGEAIGCAYQIEENKNCGETSRCKECEMRIAALTSYYEDKAIYKDHITRPFFNFKGGKVEKHLQFSTRLFDYNDEKYIIMIVDDITKFVDNSKPLTS